MVKLGQSLENLGEEGKGRGRNRHWKVELTERQMNLARDSRGRSTFTGE